MECCITITMNKLCTTTQINLTNIILSKRSQSIYFPFISSLKQAELFYGIINPFSLKKNELSGGRGRPLGG